MTDRFKIALEVFNRLIPSLEHSLEQRLRDFHNNEPIDDMLACVREALTRPSRDVELVNHSDFMIDECERLEKINLKLLEALKEAKSALSTLNYKGKKPFIRDGGEFYGQTDEWCEWVETEILPVVRQAIAEAGE